MTLLANEGENVSELDGAELDALPNEVMLPVTAGDPLLRRVDGDSLTGPLDEEIPAEDVDSWPVLDSPLLLSVSSVVLDVMKDPDELDPTC